MAAISKSIIIGVGGTGKWVLTYLKKALLDDTGGKENPGEVKLLAFDFDTSPQIDEKRNRSIENRPILVIGDLVIDESWVLPPGRSRYVQKTSEENPYTPISWWFPPNPYPIMTTAWALWGEDDVSRVRAIGRKAIFKGPGASPGNSTGLDVLRDSIRDIGRKTEGDRNLEICIVASLAGGTGSGMAIDIAHLARTLAEEIIGPERVAVQGFFVLPLEKRLFDLCYLVDPHQAGSNLDDVEPECTVSRSLAEALLALVDEKEKRDRKQTTHVNRMMAIQTWLIDIAYLNLSAIRTSIFDLPINEISPPSSAVAIEILKRLAKLRELYYPVLSDFTEPEDLSLTTVRKVLHQMFTWPEVLPEVLPVTGSKEFAALSVSIPAHSFKIDRYKLSRKFKFYYGIEPGKYRKLKPRRSGKDCPSTEPDYRKKTGWSMPPEVCTFFERRVKWGIFCGCCLIWIALIVISYNRYKGSMN